MELLKLEDYSKLESAKVIKYFIEISKIPRKSGEEQKIVKYLENFAKEKKLQYIKDEYENIIIYKKATEGKEGKKTIALQAHTDMICEKEKDIQHDFLKDPITLYKEGDYITANGTTLGADNGIGVAYMLAILDSNIPSPNLECIFTSQEETTMIGAIKIDEKNIKSKKIISLDNGKEGKILISSANCNEWVGRIETQKSKTKLKQYYQLKYENFLGGHSGGNIGDEKRGNPIKLAMKALEKVEEIKIIKLIGGSRVNVIPREVTIEFCLINNKEIDKILEEIKRQKEKFQKETIELKVIKTEQQKEIYSTEISKKIINFINTYKNGALEREKNDNVILSSNLAVIKEYQKGIQIEFSERSNEKELEEKYLNELKKLLEIYNINIIWHQELKGVAKREKNELLDRCQKIYKKIFKHQMEEIISQGVVGGGFFTDKIPNCEYVCIGPNSYNVHSPKEKLSISSTEKIWIYLNELLKNI